MRKLFFSVVLLSFCIVSNAQNISILSTGMNIPSNTTMVGETLPVNTSMNVSNPNAPVYCFFEFTYLVNGAIPVNATSPVPATLLIPGNTTSEVGPTAFSDLFFDTEGISNVTVSVAPINCTDLNAGNGDFDAAGILVLAAAPIPALGQWGMIILGFLVLIVGVVHTQNEKRLGVVLS